MPTLLYDADCGFCTRAAVQVHRLGVRAQVQTIQDCDLQALGIDADRAMREMPFVDDRGRVTYGHLAWAEALRTGPLPTRLVGDLVASRPLAPLSARVYRWVSEHRTQLPGGTPQCALPPQPGGEDSTPPSY